MSTALQPPLRSALNPRLVVRHLAVVILFACAVVGLYLVLPVGDGAGTNVLAGALLVTIALGLLALAYLVGLRRVATSQTPVVGAISLLTMFLVTFVVLFAYVYLSLQTRLPGQIPGLTTHVDSLYFTVTMLTTVGFGDIAPAGQEARVIATVQMLVNLVFIGLVVQSAVRVGRDASQTRLQTLMAASGGGRDSATGRTWQTAPPGRSAAPEGDA